MVGSRAATVDEHVAEAPEERRLALETLRRLCLEELVGYEENVTHGGPSYSRDGGTAEVAFAGQKNHISLYALCARVS
jgi:uncharacterized protein YdhG (YjbR/CyaY superfamily)